MSLAGGDFDRAMKQAEITLHAIEAAVLDLRAVLARVTLILDKVAATLNATLK